MLQDSLPSSETPQNCTAAVDSWSDGFFLRVPNTTSVSLMHERIHAPVVQFACDCSHFCNDVSLPYSTEGAVFQLGSHDACPTYVLYTPESKHRQKSTFHEHLQSVFHALIVSNLLFFASITA